MNKLDSYKKEQRHKERVQQAGVNHFVSAHFHCQQVCLVKVPLYTVMHLDELVSWCFEPSQPQRITSGLETNVNPSPSYSAQKLSNHIILLNLQN